MPALEGIIVRTYPSSEADLVLRIISPSEGRISLLAKHARKSTRRFAGGLDLFDRGTFQTARSRGNLAVLSSFSRRPPFGGLREDLGKLTLSSLICECFDLLVQEDATGAEAVYQILEEGLQTLAKAEDTREALRCCHAVLLKLLAVTGIIAKNGDEAATPRSLLSLLAHIEAFAERKIVCRCALDNLLADLQRREHA